MSFLIRTATTFNPPAAGASTVALSQARTDADVADIVASFIRAAASGCANRAAREKLQHAMQCTLQAAAIMRQRREARHV
jgi:hypothetical protein